MEITASTDRTDGLDSIRYTAIIDGEEVAYLLAHTTGLILNIEVAADHQGEGIARALYEYADNAQGLYHVPAWGRTADGEGFANAMGGDVMDDEQAAEILGLDLDLVTGFDFAA